MLIELNRPEIKAEIKSLYSPDIGELKAYFDSETKELVIINFDSTYRINKIFSEHTFIVRRSFNDRYKKNYYSIVSNNEVNLEAAMLYIKSFDMDLTIEYVGRSSFINSCFYNIITNSEEAEAMFLLYFSHHMIYNKIDNYAY